jgi:hypothetical protein
MPNMCMRNLYYFEFDLIVAKLGESIDAVGAYFHLTYLFPRNCKGIESSYSETSPLS